VDLGTEVIIERSSPSQNEFVIAANLETGAKEARIIFVKEDGKVTYTAGPGKHDSFEVWKGQDGKIAFYSGMIPYSTRSIARQILEAVLD
jgi:hypothetical protein